MSEPIYHSLVDGLVAKYASQYKLKEKEMTAFAKHLKSEWKGVKAMTTKTVKKAVKKTSPVKKEVAKAAKTAVKKAVSSKNRVK